MAGAGNDKRTAAYRIAHMVSNLGIPPKEILGVSFTNKPERNARPSDRTSRKRQTRGITLTTFHSLGVKILRQKLITLGI